MRNAVVELLACLLLVTVLETVQDTWERSWKCIKDRCLPSEDEEGRESVELCALTCGSYGALWPSPVGRTELDTELVPFHPRRLSIESNQVVGKESKEIALQMAEIFKQNLVKECKNISDDPGTEVIITVVTTLPKVTLDWSTNESYSLQVSTEGLRVRVLAEAVTVFGARHALETLSQLVACPAHAGGSLQMVRSAYITDEPQFAHRGLLLDTGRNFLSEDAIRRTVDAMAASKLNVLHWHATDSQSFPLHLPSVSQMARFGAYSPKEVYTANSVSQLIQYACIRGVRVVIEIDGPSHAANGWQWGEEAGLGDLAVCVNKQPWRKYCIQPPCGQLNPTNPGIYQVLRELYKDLLSLMPVNEVLHMGGDEVFIPCWNSTLSIVKWMKEHNQGRNTEDFLQLWAGFHATSLRILDEERGHNNTPTILWSSHLTDPQVIEKYLSKERFIIETWVPSKDTLPQELLSKGYRLIIATKDAWYFDHGFWGATTYHQWRKVYSNTIPKVNGVLGGEAALWGELVDDNSLDIKMWPRGAALAERLWTNPNTSAYVAEARMYQHRERLIRRGISADALTPRWCYLYQNECQ